MKFERKRHTVEYATRQNCIVHFEFDAFDMEELFKNLTRTAQGHAMCIVTGADSGGRASSGPI